MDALDAMDSAPFTGLTIDGRPPRILAALGPKMLALSADKADGAHPYFTTPEHTARAREILGEDKFLAPEQMVVPRVREHLDAGADHVCVQALVENPADLPMEDRARLAEALLS